MNLQQIIKKVQPLQTVGNIDVDICDIEIDSRKVKKGMLFIAMRGTQVDGHAYISKAIENGAAAVCNV